MKSGVGTGQENDQQERPLSHPEEEPGESQGLLGSSSSSEDHVNGGGGPLNLLAGRKRHGSRRSRNFSSSSRDRLELSVMSLMGQRQQQRDPSQDSLLDPAAGGEEEDDDDASPTHTVKIETPSPNSSQFATPSHGLGEERVLHGSRSEILNAAAGVSSSSCDGGLSSCGAGTILTQEAELVPAREDLATSTDQGKIRITYFDWPQSDRRMSCGSRIRSRQEFAQVFQSPYLCLIHGLSFLMR